MLYLVKGDIRVEGYGRMIEKHLAIFEEDPDKTYFSLRAHADAEYIVALSKVRGSVSIFLKTLSTR